MADANDTRTCGWCGKEYVKILRVTGNKYCDSDCRDAARRVYEWRRKKGLDFPSSDGSTARAADALTPAGAYWCNRCYQFKPLAHFNKHGNDRMRCKDCDHADRVKYYGAKTRRGIEEAVRRERAERLARRRRFMKLRRVRAAARRPTVAERWRERYRTDRYFRLRELMRSRVNKWLKEGKQMRAFFDLVDYDAEDLRRHIERQFSDGMTWKHFMRGEIHIDHIIPLAHLRPTDTDSPEFRRAWALPNLRPMWAADNLAKKDNVENLL